MAFVTFVRIRLIDFPLERDEGEYAYMGQLILQGIPPYKYAYNMKLPGTYGMYALFMKLFGESIRGIHFGFLLTNLSTIVVLFLFVKKLFNPFIALTASSALFAFRTHKMFSSFFSCESAAALPQLKRKVYFPISGLAFFWVWDL